MPKSISYTNNGDGTATLEMEWTADKSKLDQLGIDAGKYFYNARWTMDGKGWDGLTNQEKLGVLLKETTFHLRKGAYTQYRQDTVKNARDGMEDEEERYDMEND
jgi:hypothetical protein